MASFITSTLIVGLFFPFNTTVEIRSDCSPYPQAMIAGVYKEDMAIATGSTWFSGNKV